MFHLNRSLLHIPVFLGLCLCCCVGNSWCHPALAAPETETWDRATDLKRKEPPVTGPTNQATATGKYGRLPEHFIVNQGQADERIQIYMEGEKTSAVPTAKVAQEVDPPKTNLLLRPYIKNVNSRSEATDEAVPGVQQDEGTIVGGYVTTVNGPGVLSFRWKVSCKQTWAYLEVTLDGAQVWKISGERDWHLETVDIPAGSHTLGWFYRKDVEIVSGADCGWLDQVEFSPTKLLDSL